MGIEFPTTGLGRKSPFSASAIPRWEPVVSTFWKSSQWSGRALAGGTTHRWTVLPALGNAPLDRCRADYLRRKFGIAPTPLDKGTDVSLAAHLIHLGSKAKWVCVISGDGDPMPAINLFREVNPSVKFEVARPYRRDTKKMHPENCTNISPEDYLACLLPNPAATKKRKISKPDHW
jgi:hypothetical protein